MSVAFTDVRLKGYLEMRGADAGPWNRICALPALWVGLLYDKKSLDDSFNLAKTFQIQLKQRILCNLINRGWCILMD